MISIFQNVIPMSDLSDYELGNSFFKSSNPKSGYMYTDLLAFQTTQYRMHEKIMRFPSDELYESKLVAAEGVIARLLKDLPYEVKETEDTTEPLIFFDTQGGDFLEKSEEEDMAKKFIKGMMGESKSNEMEAALVKTHVQNLVDAGVKPEDIAVVTPYNAQVRQFLHSYLMFSWALNCGGEHVLILT
jgi:superfamily I DNA and/or RNA helicase